MNERVNNAVQALIADKSLLTAFKKQPAVALKRFNLLECELDAVKRGDDEALLNHGLDPMLIDGNVSAPHWFSGLFANVSRRMAAPAVIAILLAIGIHAADTQSASAARANLRAKSHVRSAREHQPTGLKRSFKRASARARKVSNVRTAQARVRTRASARAGLSNALSQIGCERCGLTDGR